MASHMASHVASSGAESFYRRQVRFLDLGPLEVSDTGEPVPLGGVRIRTLLGRLLTNPGRPVSTNKLIDAVWPDSEPERHARSFETLMWRLRNAVEPGRNRRSPSALIKSVPGGYLFDPSKVTVDSVQFLQLAEEAGQHAAAGNTAAAVAAAGRAQQLWRGSYLGDEGLWLWAAPRRRRLHEMAEAVEYLRWSALLTLGEHDIVVQETGPATAQRPLDEKAWAARIRSQIAAGQPARALDSYGTIRRLVREQLGVEPGAELRDLHRQLLADESEPQQSNGAAKTINQIAGRLPFMDDYFIGRTAEVDDVCTQLSSGRLVTVTGTGGTGKTRLALEVGRRAVVPGAQIRFADLSFLSADTMFDQHSLAAAVAGSLELAAATSDPLAALITALSRHETLLILDNCEQIHQLVSTLVAALLASAPRLRVLATSRIALSVPGQILRHLQPLTDDAAADLLIHRLVAAGHPAPPARGDARVAAICAAVANLPLGLELAAARAGTFTLDELAASLIDEPNRVTGAGGTPARHRSMHATIGWSFGALPPKQQVLYRRLSVFSSAFDVSAATAVCAFGSVKSYQMPGLLAGLAHHSVLTADRGGASGRPISGLRMLLPIRSHASRELRRSNDQRTTEQHLQHYLARFVGDRPSLAGADHGWYDRFEDLWPTVRAALPGLQATPELLPDLAVALCCFGLFRHRSAEITDLLNQLSAQIRKGGAGSANLTEDILAVVDAAAAVVATYRLGKSPGGVPDAVNAAVHLTAFRAAAGQHIAAELMVLLALAAWHADAYADADALLTFAQPAAHASADQQLILAADAVSNLNGLPAEDVRRFASSVARSQNDYAPAVACGAELAAFLNSATQAVAATILGHPDEALHATDNQRLHYLSWGNRDLTDQLEQRAVLLSQSGQHAQAARHFGAAHAERSRAGLGHGSLGPYSDLARAATREQLGPELDDRLWSAGELEGAAIIA